MEYFSQIFEKLATWWFDLNFTSIQKRALLAISAVVVVISVFIVVRGNMDEVTAPPVVVEQVQAPQIFVDVTGAVNTPGVYTLTASSRVIDAIKAAGCDGFVFKITQRRTIKIHGWPIPGNYIKRRQAPRLFFGQRTACQRAIGTAFALNTRRSVYRIRL